MPQNVILEIASALPTNNSSTHPKKIYCGWSGEASKSLPPNSVFTHGANGKLDVLEIDPQLGQAVGLQDGQKVNVEFCRNVPECATVSVEPLTEDDWEILELHAGYVEEHLLSQIRAVYTDQTMCVWIHGKTLVRLVVAELDPKQGHLKLTNTSEVIVAPKVRRKEQEVVETDLNSDKKAVAIKVQPSIGLRACPLVVDDLEVHMHPDAVDGLVCNGVVPDRVRLTKLVPGFLSQSRRRSAEEEGQQEEAVKQEDLFAKAVFARLVLSTAVPLKHVAIGSVLKNILEIKDFDIIK